MEAVNNWTIKLLRSRNYTTHTHRHRHKHRQRLFNRRAAGRPDKTNHSAKLTHFHLQQQSQREREKKRLHKHFNDYLYINK